jgi:SAM-dependent methyltransferase
MEVSVRGGAIDPARREFVEMDHYQSGRADADAQGIGGDDNPARWDRVLETHEPLSPPVLRWLLSHPTLGPRVRGKVIDLGAGTCWTSALISQCPAVTEMWAYDLSENFLMTTGLDMFTRWNGVREKLRFGVGDFNALPFEADSFDTAFFIASIHHSVTPYLALTQAIRCVRRGGRVFIIETPTSTMRVRMGRAQALALSRGAATEVCYTAGELEYLIDRSCLPLGGKSGRRSRHPFDLHSRGWKSLARKGLRATGLEYIVRPPATVYEIEVV